MYKTHGAFLLFTLLFCAIAPINEANAQSEIEVEAQQFDTLRAATDTIYPDKPKQERKLHDPRKAWQYSAIVPGLGQAYNRKYWKIPLIYAAGAAVYYYYYESAKNYHALHDAYVEFQNFDRVSMEARQQLVAREYLRDAEAEFNFALLESSMRSQQKHMERAVLLMFGVYFANIIDALVDGYFFSYDVNEDLTLQWQPGLLENPWQKSASPVLSLRLTF